jgi:hypothetical protein
MVQELRDQIAMLEGRADITPVMVQELRDEIARLMALPDMTPADTAGSASRLCGIRSRR